MKYFFAWALLLFSGIIVAQPKLDVPAPNYIKTIEFTGNSGITGNPVIALGETLTLKFDDIIGDEADYYYTVEHLNYDWTPSALVKSEYMDGLDNVRIFNYENSYNTLQPYTHYELTIPNRDTQRLKVTGNYILNVFNNAKELVFSRRFMVYQPIANVQTLIKRSRDLQFLNRKQVVNFTINSPDLLLRNPERTVKVLLMQNHNLKNAITNLEPQYSLGNELIYRYDQPTAFWGGNEFLKFDSKDVRAPTVQISRVELRDLYHHFLFTDRTRDSEPYTYNPDVNGQFVVRTLQGRNQDIEAEYIWTHFSLMNYEPLEGGELHLYGAFNNFELDESTRLNYNADTGLYENASLFKQGYYDYTYVLVHPNGSIDPGFINGNFEKTENEYQVLVYFRDLGARYDQIIGVGSANSINISH
ncbi:DUF5103 domain-containing protein [Antarcticibacterium flavum]|uniref:DUF5103 domain-containing protein n=1 Tax=Antarcticibacterium flavum TaxID=2058175 RepID=A0A5B7X6U7_9FLAO|nr:MULTISPECIES: DUF5103 domain-containing protein [Antarcticibacterium]MCM4160061.1 DUF5103 domain-containing protein [Antarcticibacterium sp. W02-3]QCY70353.1 DUF5103 domain-containing protein [Antarcticibacterium flavum]